MGKIHTLISKHRSAQARYYNLKLEGERAKEEEKKVVREENIYIYRWEKGGIENFS